MTPRLVKIGSAVQLARHRAGMTQTELASRVGISRVSISNIERGKNAMSVVRLDDFAKALNVSADLLTGVSAPVPGSLDAAVIRIYELEHMIAKLRAQLGAQSKALMALQRVLELYHEEMGDLTKEKRR